MLELSYIRTHIDEIKQNSLNRKAKVDIDELIKLDDCRRELLGEIETKRAERNRVSKSKPSAEEIARMRELGSEVKKLEDELDAVDSKHLEFLMDVPNLTHPDAPIGGEEDFVVLEEKGSGLKFDFEPKDHEELLHSLDLLDFERGAKVAGAKFYFAKGDLVRLNQALINYGMDILVRHGFTLMETPDMVKNEILDASGFNPRGAESQIYDINGHNLHLIGTAEITLLGYHAHEVLDLSKGPIKYAGLSHCYRTEAGAYGKASKGLYRVHQFTKLEMFVFCKPEESEKMHQELFGIEKEICDGLGLAYRVIDTPSGDLGGPAYRKFDIEARMIEKDPSAGSGQHFGEITSTSNCTDYQARRLNIKYKKSNGSSEYVHTLNGTAVVLSRFPLAIVEQYQQADESIEIPNVLQTYMGGQKLIK